ncbi:acyltransferase family protein [Luteimonas sp. TWI1437]|uniref:acyltransferase family protein n=1 Tax=unclassified Luteimonas TaxID=2629088 RepID=UPI003209F02C
MSRRHDIDALRVIAFGLLILYHVGMVYVVDWGFHIKSPTLLAWVEWPMVAINRWRMSLLFLISGLALGLVLARRAPGALAARRSWRLLLPLAFGIVAIVPVQAYCEARMLGTIDPGYGAFLLRYLQFRPWPVGTFTGAEYGFTWNHLWYLPYLWAYTLLTLAALPLLRRLDGARLRDWLTTRGRWLLWLLPPAWYVFALLVLDPRFPSTHALVDDWFNHARYFVVFAFGVLIAGSAPVWDALRARRRTLLAFALATGSLYLALRALGRWEPDVAALSLMPAEGWRMLVRVVQTVYWWTTLLALLAWGVHALNRPWPGLAYASEAVYPWYILHQSLIVLAAYWLIPLGLGPVWEPLGVLAITVAGCVLIHELLIRRVRWLRPLFGLAGDSGRRASPAASPAVAQKSTPSRA